MRDVKIEVLCEDRAQEWFLRELLERMGFRRRNIYVQISPPSRGAAEAFVRREYAGVLRRVRRANISQRKNERPLTALVVMVDGDAHGVTARKKQLSDALVVAVEPEVGDEAVALMIPTWSIETWLAWLCGWGDVNETMRLKHDAEYQRRVRQAQVTTVLAAKNWLEGPSTGELLSLKDGRRELQRVRRNKGK